MAAIKDIINKLFRRIPSTHVDGDMSIENLSGSGLQMVTTDNDGLLSKQAIPSGGGGGTPGGVDTQVQYNDSGSFGGDSGFTYNAATNTLTVDNLVVEDLDINGAANALTINCDTANVGAYVISTDSDALIRFEDNTTSGVTASGATGSDFLVRSDNGDVVFRIGGVDVAKIHDDSINVPSASTDPTGTNRLYEKGKELHWDGSAISRTDIFTMSSSQYQNLGTTDVELLPAPGANKMLVIHDIQVRAINGGSAETRAEELSVGFVSGSTTLRWGFQKDFLRGMPASATYIRNVRAQGDKINDSDATNLPLLAYSTGNYTGNPTVQFIINYSILRL